MFIEVFISQGKDCEALNMGSANLQVPVKPIINL